MHWNLTPGYVAKTKPIIFMLHVYVLFQYSQIGINFFVLRDQIKTNVQNWVLYNYDSDYVPELQSWQKLCGQ